MTMAAMDTEVKDRKELQVFAAFMTQGPAPESVSSGDSGAQPKPGTTSSQPGCT